ncbi:hypothetical protein [Neobacillus kokaensis]|uniref:Uncharacterized protein n=1 Tax=Neobacillus kokaensis TaxID=2759023 RepID=A0ABQ3MY86_9BACI|nr:hypothetical protein [Neobacillus kokaensis]GHH96871.1 hypothetical protein AM1BK_04140 [Neobacillus kokaensis]
MFSVAIFMIVLVLLVALLLATALNVNTMPLLTAIRALLNC